MKKYFYPLLVIIIFSLIITACSKEGSLNEVEENSEGEIETNSSTEEEIGENEESSEVVENEPVVNEYPPTLMYDGKLYQDTGYINTGVTCGTLDSEITSSVSSNELPTKDLESNFGEGYGIQIWTDGYISVLMDDEWIIFKDVELESDEIPEGVANFKAKVIEVSEDQILLEITELPEFVQRIQDIEDIDDMKPVSIPIETFKEVSDIDLKEDNIIQVWFNGEMMGFEEEMSYPISIGKIYRIELIEE